MQGVKIENKKHLTFCRHAESFGNVGQIMLDAPLTPTGIDQAKKLSGHYDCVIVSPLRRAQDTLYHSSITYNQLIVDNTFRERIFSLCDQMNQHDTVESDEQFFTRVSLFHNALEQHCRQYDNILLIGHAYFFNAWYRQGCYPSPPHAEMIVLSIV